MQIVLAAARPDEKIVINNFDERSIVAEYRNVITDEVMWAQRLPLATIFREEGDSNDDRTDYAR